MIFYNLIYIYTIFYIAIILYVSSYIYISFTYHHICKFIYCEPHSKSMGEDNVGIAVGLLQSLCG